MNQSGSALKRIGLAMFSIGVFLAIVLTALMVWADVEAFSYGFPRVGNEPMSGLSCPVFTNGTENTSFSVTLENGTDRELNPRVKAYISDPGIGRWIEDTKPLSIAPGDQDLASWDISAENIVLGYFVLAKAYTFASYPQADVEGSCGIFVLDIFGMSGQTLYWTWLAASLALLFSGLWLSDFRKSAAEQSTGRELARKVLTVLCVLGLIVGSVGLWVVGIVILVILAIALLALLIIGGEK